MFADAIRTALPELRREAEATMTDTFTAYSPEMVKVDGLDEETLVPQGATRGKVSGRSRESDTNTRTTDVGGVERPVIEAGLHIPLDAFTMLGELLLVPGWVLECDEVGPGSDPALVGRRWQVVDVPAKSFATARRLDVVEIPREA